MIKITLDPINGVNLEAQFRALTYNAENKTVTLYTKVVPLDAEGDEANSSIFKPAFVELVANNSTPVLKADGSYIDTKSEGYVYDAATMQGEYDYFENVAANAEVKINALILAKMQQAKLLDRFKI